MARLARSLGQPSGQPFSPPARRTRRRRFRVLATVAGLCGALSVAVPVHAGVGWEEVAARLGEAFDVELGLTRQAVDLERAVATLEHEQDGARYAASVLDHAGRESMRRLDSYRAGRAEREQVVRQRARAMVKMARGGVARIVLDEAGTAEDRAERLARGRDLRWLVRHDLRELSAYQRAELRARAELLDAERQLQALSVLATLHDVQGELVGSAQGATGSALARARRDRSTLLSTAPSQARAQATPRERLAELRTSQGELQRLQRGKGELVRPVRGRVVGRFGRYSDPILRLPMVRNGVELAARRDEDVHAPADGRVVMVAALPGFEQVVVMDLGDGRLVMLGRLWKVTVSEGDPVAAGERIASAAPKALDDGLGGSVYLELRHGDEPVDPEPRLRWR